MSEQGPKSKNRRLNRTPKRKNQGREDICRGGARLTLTGQGRRETRGKYPGPPPIHQEKVPTVHKCQNTETHKKCGEPEQTSGAPNTKIEYQM